MTALDPDDGAEIHIEPESRYDRQARIGWWDQDLLASARVIVAGAGALGNEVVKNLVLLGLGSLIVVDMDSIEITNLSRCAMFLPEDEGRFKAEVLAERAMKLNPDVTVTAIVDQVQVLGAGMAGRASVLVGAVDNREARRHINRLSWWSGTPWVDGAIGELDGVVRVYRPPASCYECGLNDEDFEDLARRRSCRLLGTDAPESGVVPTSITTASLVGAVQAQEVVKLIHIAAGILPEPPPESENGFRFHGLHNDSYLEITPHNDDCMAHEPHDGLVELDGPPESLAAAAVSLGVPIAVVELGDDHVVRWSCPTCNVDSMDGRPVWRLGPKDAVCPTCGAPRRADVRSSIAAQSDEASWPYSQWQRRTDDHLGVRVGLEHRYAWVREDDSVPGGW